MQGVVVQKVFQPCLKAYIREPRNAFITNKIALAQDGWQLCLHRAHPSPLTEDQQGHEVKEVSAGGAATGLL